MRQILDIVPSAADQTAYINGALASMAPYTTLCIPEGVKFHLRSLILPRHVNIEYTVGDDIDTYFLTSDIGSGERVYFSAHSSYQPISTLPDYDTTGATVNEWRFTAPYHPGIVIDVRKDVPGHDAYLAPGQTRDDPVRASYNILDEQSDAAGWRYEFYGALYSKYSGVYQESYRRIQTLAGIGTASWPTVPNLNAIITGTLAGVPVAKGYFLSADGSSTTVEWITGRFLSGMTIRNADTGVTATATTTATATDVPLRNQPLNQSLRTGNWTFGLPPGSAVDLLSVGGDVGVNKTVSFSQHIEETITYPGFIWRKDLEVAPTVGASVRQAASEDEKRLFAYATPKYSASDVGGMLGAVCASASFGSSLTVETSSFNIAASGITKPATGRYRINFRRAMKNTKFAVQATMHRLMSAASGSTFYTVGYEIIDASNIDIYVRLVDLGANTVAAADLPTGATLSVAVLNGDIA